MLISVHIQDDSPCARKEAIKLIPVNIAESPRKNKSEVFSRICGKLKISNDTAEREE